MRVNEGGRDMQTNSETKAQDFSSKLRVQSRTNGKNNNRLGAVREQPHLQQRQAGRQTSKQARTQASNRNMTRNSVEQPHRQTSQRDFQRQRTC
jgi:hypothetical protein